MHGITILYEYSGAEDEWRAVIDKFIAAVNSDEAIAGKFHYQVNKAKEGDGRIHWGWWDAPETVKTLQSRDYFKEFAAKLKAMAGDSLRTHPIPVETGTER